MTGASVLGLDHSPATPTRRRTRSEKSGRPSGAYRRGPAPQGGHRPPVTSPRRDVLGRYTDRIGRPREVIIRAGAAGSVLVIDRDALTLGDRRLVAHLGVDEPPENARLVVREYLADERRGCGLLTSADLQGIPHTDEDDDQTEVPDRNLLVDRHGRSYHLEPIPTAGISIPEVRWLQYPPEGKAGPPRLLTVREVIGALESYEPARTLTRMILARHRDDARVSVAVLRGELTRFLVSPFVLNRGLREAVLATTKADEVSMSEIAMRCGHYKRPGGNVCGDTSWLSRRLGLTPEGGELWPTPWIASDVLALIAREGLCMSPREVELG